MRLSQVNIFYLYLSITVYGFPFSTTLFTCSLPFCFIIIVLFLINFYFIIF